MVKGMKYSDFPSLKKFCEETKEKFPMCMHCCSMLVDIYVEEGDETAATNVKNIFHYFINNY